MILLSFDLIDRERKKEKVKKPTKAPVVEVQPTAHMSLIEPQEQEHRHDEVQAQPTLGVHDSVSIKSYVDIWS